MLEKGFILRHPLGRLTGDENEEILPEGGFGAIIARAGVGKTALLIQLAIHSLLCGKKVLHISLNDPVKKVGLWYKEVYRNIAFKYNVPGQEQLFEDMLPHRFIMTFEVEGFSVPKLVERLTDLMEQSIFRPNLIYIDGLPFDNTQIGPLSDLKEFVKKNSLKAWFTVRVHKDERPGAVENLFERVILIQSEGRGIYLRSVKGGKPGTDAAGVLLDPTTMLIQENDWIRK
jgi:hypothetical protein